MEAFMNFYPITRFALLGSMFASLLLATTTARASDEKLFCEEKGVSTPFGYVAELEFTPRNKMAKVRVSEWIYRVDLGRYILSTMRVVKLSGPKSSDHPLYVGPKMTVTLDQPGMDATEAHLVGRVAGKNLDLEMNCSISE